MSPTEEQEVALAKKALAEEREFRFSLCGKDAEVESQAKFLIANGFTVKKRISSFALAREEDYKRAIKLIWEEKIEGWWNYRNEMVKDEICTKRDFEFAIAVIT